MKFLEQEVREFADSVAMDGDVRMSGMLTAYADLLAAQPVAVPDRIPTLQFLSDVTTAAGLLEHGKRDKALANRIGDFAHNFYRALAAPSPAAEGAKVAWSAEGGLTIADYEKVLADHHALVRELDVLLNGDNAAPQASLCDIVAQVKRTKHAQPEEVLSDERIGDIAKEAGLDFFPSRRATDEVAGLYGEVIAFARAALAQQQGKDAERLDYIEKNARRDPKINGQHVWWPTSFNNSLIGPTLRAAIDAAIAASTKEQGK